jgi:hypothetical protein
MLSGDGRRSRAEPGGPSAARSPSAVGESSTASRQTSKLAALMRAAALWASGATVIRSSSTARGPTGSVRIHIP